MTINIYGMELSGINPLGSLTMGVAMAVADFSSHTRLWIAESENGSDFKLEDIPENEKSKLDNTMFSFEQNANYRIEPAIKQISILFQVNIFTDINKTRKLGEMQLLGDFELLNIEEFKIKEEYKFPKELVAMFIGIMLSTARGMLILKTEKTYLENTIIPIMNTMDFFKEPTP